MAVTGVIRAIASEALSKGAQKAAKKVVKKKISKKKKILIGGAAIIGGKQVIGKDGKPVQAGSTGISTSDANAAALAAASNQVGMLDDKTTLSGLKKGGVIAGGGTADLMKGAGATYLANLQPAQRAQALVRLGQIPGLYTSGTAPTADFIQRMIKGGDIVPRAVDFAALEQVVSFAEWSGGTIDNTIVKLISQPALAQQFFGKTGTATKAVTPLSQLQADMDSKFLDLFDSKADSGLVKAYAKEVNALESTKAGISTQQKEDILLKYVQKKADNVYSLGGVVATDKGALGRSVRALRSAYEDNGIPIDDKQIYNKAVQSLRSPDAAKNILEDIGMHASIIMPAFKDFYAKGKSAREVLSPYISVRSQILGIPEDQIRVKDMYDVGSGAVPLTIQEYKAQVYRSKEYKDSDNYKSVTLGDTTAMLRAFNLGA
jgi:hypothetical protein